MWPNARHEATDKPSGYVTEATSVIYAANGPSAHANRSRILHIAELNVTYTLRQLER